MVIGKINQLPQAEVKATKHIIRGEEPKEKFNTSLGKYLSDRLTEHGDNLAQICAETGKKETFAETKSRSIHIAEELRQLGIGIGDVVSICSRLHSDVTATALGTIFIGAILSPLDISLGKNDLKYLMNITKPKALFADPERVDVLEECIAEIGLDTIIIVYGQTNKHVPFAQCLQPRINEKDFEIVDFTNPEDHIACIIFSSGTTGLPKGCALTHKNFLMQLYCFRAAQKLPTVVVMCLSSLYWISGSVAIFSSLDRKFPRVLLPTVEPEKVLEAVQNYKVNWIATGVTYFTQMVKHPSASKYDLSSVKIYTVNGAKPTPHVLKTGKQLFSSALFTSGYGATETSGLCFMFRSPQMTKPNAVGQIIPSIEAKIVDLNTGKDVGPNEVGELYVRGALIFKEYYNNPQSTKEAIDNFGWFHTGDLAYYDDDKFFYIEDRLKEIFKSRGFQISPLEVEAALMKLPEIEQAAVIGIPHEEDVNRAQGYIVLKPGVSITAEEINKYLAEKLSPTKQLTGGVVFLDEMPTTPSGKIQRRSLFDYKQTKNMG